MPVDKLLEPLAAFLGPGAFGVLVAAIALGRWWSQRTDKTAVDLQAARAALSADQAALFKQMREQMADLEKQLRAQIADLDAQIVDLEQQLAEEKAAHREERAAHRLTSRDRDRGWDLARWWNRKAHALRHAALNARQKVDALCRLLGLARTDWSEDASTILPNELEEPIPRPPAE